MKNWIWLAMCVSSAAMAQDIGRPATIGDPSVPPTHSVEQADSRLAQVKKERDAAEAEFAADEQICYSKFFVNSCLDKAKERRRVRLAELRAIEVEASYFKRRYTVEVRDRELEDRAQKDAAEEAYRAANPPAPKVAPEDKPQPRPAAVSLEQRQAAHDAKEKKRQAEEAAAAPKRAANAAAYEKKKAESEKRQQEVAAKKAAKEEKKRKHEADEAAKKAATQSAASPAASK